MKSLSSANTTDPKDLIKAGILAVAESVKKSFNLSDELVSKADKESKRTKTALSDCKELLEDASEKLQDIIEKVGASDITTIANRSDDFRTWLSYVIGYQELCVDGFDQDSEVRADVRQSTEAGSQLTDNVLEILAGIQKGFPTWMSAADRKLLQSNPKMAPNAVVAKDGSGKFKTIGAALAGYPKNFKGRYVIYVKAGVYSEQVTVGKGMKNVYMYGDGPRKSIVTGKLSFAKDGLGTWKTASFVVEADGFIARSMGFQNTAGPEGHQAVAVRSLSDQSAFINCRLVQNSLIIVRKPLDNQFNTVTADGKKEKGQPTGIVIQNCRIVPEAKLVPDRFKLKTYLGRPWKAYSTTVVMESELGDLIQPDGWKEWDGTQFLDTLYYAEYANRGPGANTARRLKWKTIRFLSRNEAMKWTVESFLRGREWVANTGANVIYGLKS
ncbi:Putative pectinesterase/pectinesterase inhibitor 45 [Linum grandiflorum]